MAVRPTAHEPRKHARSAIAAAVCVPTLGATARAYQATDVVNPGAIAGAVRFEGDPPPATVRMTTDSDVCGAEKTSSDLYRLELWHESLGTRSQSVTAAPQQRVLLTLEMAKR